MVVKISLQICKILAPNCGAGDTVEATFTLADASGRVGTTRIVGTKNSVNAIDHANYLEIDGVTETTSISTIFGSVTVEKSFEAGFDIYENITVTMHVIDCKGWHNIEDAEGWTNAVMTSENNFIMDENGDYLAFVV